MIKQTLLLLSFTLILQSTFAQNESSDNSIKLYTIDCGTLDVLDMKDLSRSDIYNGQKLTMVNPCYLIRHPKGDLLWETGHIDSLADKSNGELAGVWHSKRANKLSEQLAKIGLNPIDIDYLSLSHVHPDHAGNANMFAGSTFIVNQQEHEYMFSDPIESYFGAFYSALKQTKTIKFTEIHDVFSDGKVMISSMPGHTPGSSVLLLKLANAGNFLLTGDLYTHARARELKTMHSYNDQTSTLASREKFEALAKKENAQVLIHHAKAHFEQLPAFPKYLD